MLTLHVEPHNGTWIVRPDGEPRALSQHADAGAATLAAYAWAQDAGGARVLVHDRYYRVHDAAAPAFSREAHAVR